MKIHHVLVTGANGFIGHHLCNKLLDQQFKVTALTRSDHPKYLHNLKKNTMIQIVIGDINNHRFLVELFNKYKIDAILHLAIAPSSQSSQTDQGEIQDSPEYQTNFSGTLDLLKVAHQAGVKNWIQSSTMSIFDFNNPQYLPVDENHPTNPVEPYGFTKLLAENACNFYQQYFGFNMIILRYSGVYGIGKNHGLIAKFMQHCGDLDIDTFNASINRTSDFVYVDDVVNANLLSLKKISNTQNNNSSFYDVFNIGSGQETSVYEIVNFIKELTDSKIKILKEKSEHHRRFYFDCRKAIKLLNYQPTPIKDALKKYIEQIPKNQKSG